MLIGLFFMFLSRRDLRTVVLVAGLLMSEALNYVLKKLLRFPRPDRACRGGACSPLRAQQHPAAPHSQTW